MKTIFLGKNCIELDKTGSTNSYLASLQNDRPLFEGTVVITKHQEQGRGQRGSTWESEPGKNLTLSILLQPTFLRPEEQFQLNKAVSLGVLEFVLTVNSPFSPTRSALAERGERGVRLGRTGDVKIKWPNDIYIGTKKVAGILIENSVSSNKLQQSIIGIGINVNQENFSTELPNPTSLKLATGREFNLNQCLEELCSCIEKRYLQLRSQPHPTQEAGVIDIDYLKNLYRFEEWANYWYNEETIKAKITGVSRIGKLMLETEKGEKLECDFKEIRFR